MHRRAVHQAAVHDSIRLRSHRQERVRTRTQLRVLTVHLSERLVSL